MVRMGFIGWVLGVWIYKRTSADARARIGGGAWGSVSCGRGDVRVRSMATWAFFLPMPSWRPRHQEAVLGL